MLTVLHILCPLLQYLLAESHELLGRDGVGHWPSFDHDQVARRVLIHGVSVADDVSQHWNYSSTLLQCNWMGCLEDGLEQV